MTGEFVFTSSTLRSPQGNQSFIIGVIKPQIHDERYPKIFVHS